MTLEENFNVAPFSIMTRNPSEEQFISMLKSKAINAQLHLDYYVGIINYLSLEAFIHIQNIIDS